MKLEMIQPKPHVGDWALWESDSIPKELHVYPKDDTAVHHLNAFCWCKPERDYDSGDVVVHNRQRDHLS